MSNAILQELREIRRLLEIIAMSPKYWEYIPTKTDTPFVIPAGSKKTILDVKETGKVLGILAITDNPDVYVEVSFDGKRIGRSLRELYEIGLTKCTPGFFWILKWDEANNVYIAIYTPPGEPASYFGHFEFTVYAPKDSPATVSYVIHRYRLKSL